MLGEVTPAELGGWAALWRIDPPNETRGDLRIGILASLVANMMRDSKKKSDPFTAADFMPYVQREAKDRDLSRRLRTAFKQIRKAP